MVSYQYSYLIGSLIILGVWVFLYLWRKDARKEMIAISILFLFAGFTELIYVRDWWRPLTITGTVLGIEDFIFSFSIGGIAAVIYGLVFNKKVRSKKISLSKSFKNINFLVLLLGILTLFLGGVYVLGMNTLQATVISLLFGISHIWIQRKDLIINSLFSGFLLLIFMFPIFWIVESITPGFVQEFWFFENIPNIVILKMPLDDFIFYLLAGAFIGPLFEYWQEARLINSKK